MSARWIFMVMVLLVGCGQGYVEQTNQFAVKVKAVANPNELQAWATNLIAQTSTNADLSIPVAPSDIPKWTGAIYHQAGQPEEVTIEKARIGDTNAYVQIMYGGGFGHWAVLIGYPSLVFTNSSPFYYLPWKPGIYFCNGP